MGDVSKHFSRWEYACPCGCGFDTIDAETVMVHEFVRAVNGGKSMSPTSGCRCPAHNLSVTQDPDSTSEHMKGRAVDQPVDDPQAVYDALCARWPDRFGFGLYSNRVHFDTKTGPPRRWQE